MNFCCISTVLPPTFTIDNLADINIYQPIASIPPCPSRHLPLCVLCDLVWRANESREVPWRLKVHFTEPPTNLGIWSTNMVAKDAFLTTLKEATYVCKVLSVLQWIKFVKLVVFTIWYHFFLFFNEAAVVERLVRVAVVVFVVCMQRFLCPKSSGNK
jgi:Autophagy protein Apg5